MLWHLTSKIFAGPQGPAGWSCSHQTPHIDVWGLSEGICGTIVVCGWLGHLWQQYVALIRRALPSTLESLMEDPLEATANLVPGRATICHTDMCTSASPGGSYGCHPPRAHTSTHSRASAQPSQTRVHLESSHRPYSLPVHMCASEGGRVRGGIGGRDVCRDGT